MMADSMLYVLRPVRSYGEAERLVERTKGRVFAVRPNWSMPAREWVSADPEFWQKAPTPKTSR